MGLKVEALTSIIRLILSDSGSDLWSNANINAAILEAEKAIVNFRPDASSVDATLTCAVGARQSIAALTPKPNRLIDVKYNIPSSTPGRSIKAVTAAELDAISPTWRAATATATIKEFIFDPREPLLFYVNPPAASGAAVRISYSATPADYGTVNSSTETTIDAIFEPMVTEFALYRLFGYDQEGSVNIGRSSQHFQNFQVLMGLKIQGESRGAKSLTEGTK